MNRMIKFKSIIFGEILVEGKVNLKSERKFKLFRNFELNVIKDGQQILNISTSTKLMNFSFIINSNKTNFIIEILNQSHIIVDEDHYEIEVERFYPFKKKYGDVLVNNEKIGEVVFESKVSSIILNFLPSERLGLDDEKYLKIAILILINIANLDGSE